MSRHASHPGGRRRWLRGGLALAGLGSLGPLAWNLGQAQVMNPCHAALPPALAGHPLVQAAWQGVQADQVWDCHVHLAGTGDAGRGIEMSPDMLSPLHPVAYLQRLFYLNAGCAHDAPGRVDDSYVARLHNLMAGLAPGCKLMLYAFDRVYDAQGRVRPELTAFHVPDAYARDVARAAPHWFEWVCSIHPWRADAVEALQAAVAAGARAVKWLPPAMGIDPAAPACDAFYRELARLQVPLISHAGEEKAVKGSGQPAWGNPLRLRRALEHGVRVVMAHCASHGEDVDTDRGEHGPRVPSFALFRRMMGESGHDGLLFGDISAVILRNRDIDTLRTLLERDDWHARLLYGSDYPLPGIVPLIAPARLARAGLLPGDAVAVLETLREHNPLLFSFVLTRHLASDGQRFAASVFETRRFFDRTPS